MTNLLVVFSLAMISQGDDSVDALEHRPGPVLVILLPTGSAQVHVQVPITVEVQVMSTPHLALVGLVRWQGSGVVRDAQPLTSPDWHLARVIVGTSYHLVYQSQRAQAPSGVAMRREAYPVDMVSPLRRQAYVYDPVHEGLQVNLHHATLIKISRKEAR